MQKLKRFFEVYDKELIEKIKKLIKVCNFVLLKG